MKKFFILISLFAATGMLGQKTLNEYSYVVIPEQYDFTNGKNGFELNEMTKYYLNKHGFNAFMTTEVPNVKRCDGLYADVQKEGGFVGTKLVLLLKNCEGVEVYRSKQGKSKLKEFRKAYHEAIREVFAEVELLNIDQKDITIYEDIAIVPKSENIEKKDDVQKIKKDPVKVDDAATMLIEKETMKVVLPNEVKTKVDSNNSTISSTAIIDGLLPKERFSSYTEGDKTFLLRKTSTGYSLYEETATAEDGLLLLGKLSGDKNPLVYKNSLDVSGQATFDKNSNLTIKLQGKTTSYTNQN